MVRQMLSWNIRESELIFISEDHGDRQGAGNVHLEILKDVHFLGP